MQLHTLMNIHVEIWIKNRNQADTDKIGKLMSVENQKDKVMLQSMDLKEIYKHLSSIYFELSFD